MKKQNNTNNNENYGYESQEEIQDRTNQQKYEQIIRRQNAEQRNNIGNNNRNLRPPYQNQQNQYQYQYKQSNKPPLQNQNRQFVRPQENYNNQEKQPKHRKHKGCGCFTFFIVIFLVFAIATGSMFYGLYSLCSKTEYVGEDTDIMSDIKLKDVYNVLLIGEDKDENGTSRSDSMILVTVDRENKKLKFTSFMRDVWVEIPDNGEAKLNAAYAYGGADLLIDTIEENFKIGIDNYVMVDFEMFKELIDAMGGVTVDITEEEAEFINRTSHAKVTSGQNTLDGDYALIYCRIRKLDSDFMRTQRQRKVMTALFKKIISDKPTHTIKAMKDVLPLITTDISPLKMTVNALSAFSFVNYSSDDMRIPVDGTYEDKTIRGQAALLPDLEENQEALESFIYGN